MKRHLLRLSRRAAQNHERPNPSPATRDAAENIRLEFVSWANNPNRAKGSRFFRMLLRLTKIKVLSEEIADIASRLAPATAGGIDAYMAVCGHSLNALNISGLVTTNTAALTVTVTKIWSKRRPPKD